MVLKRPVFQQLLSLALSLGFTQHLILDVLSLGFRLLKCIIGQPSFNIYPYESAYLFHLHISFLLFGVSLKTFFCLIWRVLHG